MIRSFAVGWAALALAAAASAASAQTLADPAAKNACGSTDANLPDNVRIDACSLVLAAGLETNETLAHAHSNRGSAYARIGDYTKAIADFDEAIKMSPLDAVSFTNRGNAYLSGPNDPVKAMADFDQAIALNSHYANAFFSRARAWAYKHEDAKSLADLDQTLALDPKFEAAWIARGQGRLGQRNYNGAIADFSEVIAHDPKNPDAFNGRCWGRAVLGVSLDGALADCGKALELQPNDANTLNSLGLVDLRRGDFKGAAAAYDASYARNPHLPGSLYGRGIARLKLGEIGPGKADLAAAVKGQSDLPQIYAGYGFPPPA